MLQNKRDEFDIFDRENGSISERVNAKNYKKIKIRLNMVLKIKYNGMNIKQI